MMMRLLMVAMACTLSACGEAGAAVEHRACAAFFQDRYGAQLPVPMSSFQTLDESITVEQLRRRFYPGRLSDLERLHFISFENRPLTLRTVWFNANTGVRPGGIVELQGFMCKFLLVNGELYRAGSLIEDARRMASNIKMSEVTSALGDRRLNRRVGELVRDRELAHECCLP